MQNLLFSLTDIVNNLNNTLGIWYLIILNAFGVIAIICKIIEYQVKKRTTMFVMVTVACACWSAYFLLYGNLISALTCALSVVRFLIFVKRETCKWAKSVLWLYVFIAMQTAVVVYTIIVSGFSWLNIFTILAGYVGIFAYYVNHGKMYRFISFIHMSLWVVNSAIFFYPIALLSDSFSTISCGVAIYRFDLRKNARNKEKREKISEN